MLVESHSLIINISEILVIKAITFSEVQFEKSTNSTKSLGSHFISFKQKEKSDDYFRQIQLTTKSRSVTPVFTKVKFHFGDVMILGY